MTQQIAESVKNLAKPCSKALGRIAERECPNPECDEGYVGIYIADEKCPTCNGTGKVSYQWVPEVNQTVLYDKKLMFIVSVGEARLSLLPFDIPDFGESLDDYVYAPEIIDVIPILEWEDIEKVLHENDYSIHMEDLTVEGSYAYEFEIHQEFDSDSFPMGKGKSRQEAVMRAVIALGKKLRQELDAKSK